MTCDSNGPFFGAFSTPNDGGVTNLKRQHRTQSSRIALRATIAFVAVTGINMLAPSQAWANCVIAADIVCDGSTGPDTFQSISGFISVTYLNGETNSSTKGLAVSGGIFPDVNVAIDATSSIITTDATGAAAGAALKLSTTAGNISTTTPSGSGINGNLSSTVGPGLNAISTGGGNITIVQGATSTITGSASGITITASGGAGQINLVANGKVIGNTGIVATSSGAGGVAVTAANVTANNGIGIDAQISGFGVSNAAVTVTTLAGGTISANGGTGILAQNQLKGSGGITILNDAAMKVSGGNGIFAILNQGTGDIKITSNGAIGSGAGGPGTLSTGINAALNPGAQGNIVVNLNANIGSASDVALGNGIAATNGGSGNLGNINVNVTNASIFAGSTGINAQQFGKGNLTITGTGTGTISSANATGINAQLFNANPGNITVAVTQDVIGKTGGITAVTPGDGNISVTAGNVTSSAGTGIQVANTNVAANAGTITVNLAAGKAINALGGIGTNTGISTGLTTITANGNISASAAAGIVATSNGGATTINQAAASTINAATDAIKVNSGAAGGAINVSTAGTLVANNGSGVFVQSASTTADPITVTTNIIRSTGAAGTWGSQVRASAGSGDIVINSNGTIGSATGPSTIFGGILALTTGTSNRNITVNVNADIGTATDLSSASQVLVNGTSSSAKTLAVNINNASIFGGPGAVQVQHSATSLGDIVISGTGTGTLSATKTGAIGINARNLNAANNGNITVDVTQNVVGVAQGINASTVGGGNISVTARGNVTSTAGGAMVATNANAAANAGTILVQVAGGKLVSATGGNGITTDSGLSTGATTIVVAGEVKASGAGFAGIKGTSTAGNISVLVAATGKVDPDIGIDLATVNGALLVNNAGLVQGDVTAIKLVATGTGTAAIINSGTVTGGTNAVLGSTNNTAFTIANNAGGIMNGAINVTGSALAASQFTNAGIWNATSSSSFSGSLVNTGTTNVANGAALTIIGPTNNSGILRFVGNGALTTNLTNSGTLSTQNGATGGALVLNGNYVGGGQFLADYNSGTITADTLRITGTASGITNVGLNRVGAGFLPTGFLPIVTVVPGGAASLFTSATALPSSGFLLETFGQNPTNNTQWGVIQVVNPVFGDLGGVSALANTVSAMLNDPASAFVTQKADAAAGETQIGLWMRGGAGDTKEDLTTMLSSGAFAASFNSRLRMSHQVLQLGLDYGLLNMGGNGWSLHFGVTGGKLDAGAKRTGSATNIQFDSTFAGAYAFMTNGALTLDASVRKEWREFRIASAGLLAVSPQDADGDATVASFMASYRIGGATGFQLTPHVAYSYGDSEIDPFAIDAFTQFVPGGDKTKLGQAGIRIGYKGESGNVRFEPFVSATALRNWSNREDAAVVFAGPSTTNFDVNTIAFRNAMRYSLGLQGSDKSGKISAFVVGSLTDGNHVEGMSVSVGARINF